MKRVRLHDLRHTNVSLRIDEGQIIVYISKQIGHESPDTTLKVYAHLFKEVQPEQAVKLDRALGFTELPGSPSESVRYLLGNGPKDVKKGSRFSSQPIELIGSGERI